MSCGNENQPWHCREPPAGPTHHLLHPRRPREVKLAVDPGLLDEAPKQGGPGQRGLTLTPRSRGTASLTGAKGRAGALHRGNLWPER